MNFKSTIVFSLVALCSYYLPIVQQSCAGQDKGSTKNQQIILVEPEEDGVFPENGTLEEKLAYFNGLNWGLFQDIVCTKVAKRSLDVEMPLSEKLKWLEKYTAEFCKKLDDVVATSGERLKVKRYCDRIQSHEVKVLLESVKSIKLKLSKTTAMKLMIDPEILALVATSKYSCIKSQLKLNEVEKFVTDKPTLEALAEAKGELDKMLACCESACFQVGRYQEGVLKTRKSDLHKLNFVLTLEKGEFCFQPREEYDKELAQAQAEAEEQR
ncbi:MAG: hypothetical protein ACOX3T_02380 [Bdellovibrionota bacterium]